ncbi:MAG: ABC transporter permease [Oscillospiraceae bacterium]|jgi:putative ABC transport system permease protein|nr:ABC transporter permease [Oscillospiraceae bacterium]
MFLKENILLAVTGLRSNKMRAFLTMLGIIIGIGSVIAIVSIGNAVTASVSDTMADMGANNIEVYVTPKEAQNSTYSVTVGGDNMDENDLISIDQISAFQQKYSNEIAGISYQENLGSGKAKDGRRYANVSIEGVNTGYKKVNNVKMIKGRFLQEKDIEGAHRVAVVSDRLVSNMFRGQVNPIGKTINVDETNGEETYTIVGIYHYEQSGIGAGAAAAQDVRTDLYIPVSIAKEQAQYQNYLYFTIQTVTSTNAKSFAKKINSYFYRIYANNPNYTCEAYNMESAMSSVTKILNTISTAVAAIAAIALLVGGIGVMNIMLVSVTERTREIGTRKALGARSSYIRMQFIVEAVIICLIGGIIGIIVGILLAWGGVSLLHLKMVISIPTILISVGFSMLIGIFFGYYPAKKASRLDPIDALRYE